MNSAEAGELIERIDTIRRAPGGVERISEALRGITRLRAWLDGCEAELAAATVGRVAAPLKEIAESAKISQRAADRVLDRYNTANAIPSFGAALNDGDVSGGHLDALASVIRSLEPAERHDFRHHAARLVDHARTTTVDEFRTLAQAEARRFSADHGEARLARQKRATRLRSWLNPSDGMWRLSGSFDPESGLALHGRLNNAVSTLFHQAVPDDAPDDPGERADYLRAHALLALTQGNAGTTGRPEIIAVIHIDPPDQTPNASRHQDPTDAETGLGSTQDRPAETSVAHLDRAAEPGGGSAFGCHSGATPTDHQIHATQLAAPPHLEWGLPVEVPWSVVRALYQRGAIVEPVVVRNGVVLHAPGEMNLGRATRLASRAQRRALRAIYPRCAMTGCDVGFDHTQPHHIRWWEHGGLTDLDDLLPLCSRHHHLLHDSGWSLHLDHHRRLTVTYPDGSRTTTDPPHHQRRERTAA